MDGLNTYSSVVKQLTAVFQSIDNLSADCLHEELLNDKCKQLIQEALQLSQQAVLDREAAEAYQLPQLGMLPILHTLSFLPSSYKALAGNLVCKEAYRQLKWYRWIHAAELVLDEERISAILQQHAHTSTAQQKLIALVAKQGSLPLLQYVHQQGCAWDAKACTAAAGRGDLDMLKWLRSQSPPCPWDEQTCSAAGRGDLPILKWLRSQSPPCPWDEETCSAAASSGDLELLQWVRSQDPPCPWGSSVCEAAAAAGQLEVLQWAESQSLLSRRIVVYWEAAMNDHLKVLQWLSSQGPPEPEPEEHTRYYNLCEAAALNGDVAMLSWLRAQDPPFAWNLEVCRAAAENCQFHALKWLRSQDPPCPWDSSTLVTALRNASPECPILEFLQWARAQHPPCPWDEKVCSTAAGYSLDSGVLQFCRNQKPPCPWDENVCIEAAEAGCLDVLQWALAQNPPAPWSGEACVQAALRGHLNVLQWVAARQPPLHWEKGEALAEARIVRNVDVCDWLESLLPAAK